MEQDKPLTHHLHIISNYKYSNMLNTFLESRNMSMYTPWPTKYIGNGNSNTYLCLFGRLHQLDLCLLGLLETLPMCSTSSSDSEDLFLYFSWSKILSKPSYTTYYIELFLYVLPVYPFLSNDEMYKSIIFIFIGIVFINYILHYLRDIYFLSSHLQYIHPWLYREKHSTFCNMLEYVVLPTQSKSSYLCSTL